MKRFFMVVVVTCATMFVACSPSVEKMGEAFAEEMALAVLEGKEDKADSIEVASLKYLETLSEKEAERFCDALDKKFDEVMNF
jgi:hypothetical protein